MWLFQFKCANILLPYSEGSGCCTSCFVFPPPTIFESSSLRTWPQTTTLSYFFLVGSSAMEIFVVPMVFKFSTRSEWWIFVYVFRTTSCVLHSASLKTYWHTFFVSKRFLWVAHESDYSLSICEFTIEIMATFMLRRKWEYERIHCGVWNWGRDLHWNQFFSPWLSFFTFVVISDTWVVAVLFLSSTT